MGNISPFYFTGVPMMNKIGFGFAFDFYLKVRVLEYEAP